MARQKGITEAQGRRLLELAEEAGVQPKVRTYSKETAQHAGRAFLLDIPNSRQARIKPFNHGGKEEIVELTSLGLWKSGNNFNIEEVYRMDAATLVQATGRPIHNYSGQQQYVVYSRKMKCVWGGDLHKWTANFAHAATWSDPSHAARSVGKLNKAPVSDDATVLKREIAYEYLRSPQLQPVQVQPYQPSAAIALPQTVMTAPVTATETPQNEISDEGLASILAFDETSFLKSIQAVKTAHAEVQAAKKMLADAEQKFQTATLNHNSIIGLLRTSIDSASPKKRKSMGPKGALKECIREILKTHSRLDTSGIATRVNGKLPEKTRGSITQCLYTLQKSEEVERDDNGGWALTSLGRSNA